MSTEFYIPLLTLRNKQTKKQTRILTNQQDKNMLKQDKKSSKEHGLFCICQLLLYTWPALQCDWCAWDTCWRKHFFPFASRYKLQTASWLEVGIEAPMSPSHSQSWDPGWFELMCAATASVHMSVSPVTSGRQFPQSCPQLHLLPCSSLGLKGRGWWQQRI